MNYGGLRSCLLQKKRRMVSSQKCIHPTNSRQLDVSCLLLKDEQRKKMETGISRNSNNHRILLRRLNQPIGKLLRGTFCFVSQTPELKSISFIPNSASSDINAKQARLDFSRHREGRALEESSLHRSLDASCFYHNTQSEWRSCPCLHTQSASSSISYGKD
jgi:hypothetical protein